MIPFIFALCLRPSGLFIVCTVIHTTYAIALIATPRAAVVGSLVGLDGMIGYFID